MNIDVYFVTDDRIVDEQNLLDVVERAVQGGVSMVQFRDKRSTDEEFIQKALAIQQILKRYQVPFIINDRVHVALEIGADGIHVGQSDMPLPKLFQLVPKTMIIGVSVENMIQLQYCDRFHIQYIVLSPIFATSTKTDFQNSPWGLNGISIARKMTKKCLVGIGGIHHHNASEVIKHGADAIAVVTAISDAKNPKSAAHQLVQIVRQAKKGNFYV